MLEILFTIALFIGPPDLGKCSVPADDWNRPNINKGMASPLAPNKLHLISQVKPFSPDRNINNSPQPRPGGI